MNRLARLASALVALMNPNKVLAISGMAVGVIATSLLIVVVLTVWANT